MTSVKAFRRRVLCLLPRLQEPAAVLLVIAAVIAVTQSALQFRPVTRPEIAAVFGSADPVARYSNMEDYNAHRTEATGWMLLGVGLMLLALRLTRRAPVPPTPGSRSLQPGRMHWGIAAAGGGVLFLLALIGANQIRVGLDLQFGLLVDGIALVVVGLAGRRLRGRAAVPDWAGAGTYKGRGKTILLLVGIILAGFVLRAWALDDVIHLFVDELNFTNAIRGLWMRDDPRLLSPITGSAAFPRLYAYWEAHAVTVLGRNLIGLRMVSAVIGTLTIPALYLLARVLFDRPTALIAAALLAVFPPHIHFSRIGLNNIADPLFGTLALAFFACALRSGRRLDYVLAGAMLGLTQYFYEGGRLLFPALAAIWLAALIVQRRAAWRGALIAGLAAGVVAAPVYYTLLARDLPVTPRMDEVGFEDGYWQNLVRGDRETWELHKWHLQESFLVYVQMPEGSLFYGGDTPLLLVYVVPLFLLGSAAALAHARKPGPLLLILWVAGNGLGSSLIAGPPGAARYVGAFPALALVCALGLRSAAWVFPARITLPWLRLGVSVGLGGAAASARFSTRRDHVQIGLGAGWGQRHTHLRIGARARLFQIGPVVVAALAVLQLLYYFGPHVEFEVSHLRSEFPPRDGEDAMFRAAAFPPGTWVHLISDEPFSAMYAQQMVDFMASGLTVRAMTPAEVTGGYLATLPRTVDQAFFLAPEDAGTLMLIYENFPLVGPPEMSPYDVPLDEQYVLYYAPRVVVPP